VKRKVEQKDKAKSNGKPNEKKRKRQHEDEEDDDYSYDDDASKKQAENNDDDEDLEYYRQELGEEPDQGTQTLSCIFNS
jgi:hypothetical protein